MTRVIVLNIMKRHLNRGKAGDGRFCPAGLALNQLIAPGWQAYVGAKETDFVEIDCPPDETLRAFTVPHPPELERFVKQFDNDGNPAPLIVQLELPEEVLT